MGADSMIHFPLQNYVGPKLTATYITLNRDQHVESIIKIVEQKLKST